VGQEIVVEVGRQGLGLLTEALRARALSRTAAPPPARKLEIMGYLSVHSREQLPMKTRLPSC
jgi:hypothetical protein